ncbi:unnamed protein product [Adineta steineri]|uniref:Uncharacterized protein n=1 Tax=Adineta steineri TaxID=433720 RepID=A0A816CL75_9BILA|nr:unnamed protein product [Adineta steineri]CAF1626449.1 unnamed protein product [Adineta steineri]
MFSFDDNLPLKIIAWFLQFPFYIFWFILKYFINKDKNESNIVQAPQYPKTIVVTGASQGIGESLVEYYYKNCPSCEVIIMISRSTEKLEKVKNRLNSNNQRKLIIYQCDVTDSEEMKRIYLDIHRTYGQIDILFANAGVSFRQLSLTNTFDKAVRDVFNININGVINSIMPVIELKNVKQIAIVSSQAAYAPFMSPFYGTTKQCVLSLGRDLRRILAKDNIVVNVISPGPVHTPMLDGVIATTTKHGVSAEKAAEIIYDGLRRNQAEIVFPAVTGVFQYILSFLPLCIAQPIAMYQFRLK